MFQESEVVILCLALIACWIALPLLRDPALSGRIALRLGFCLMVAAHIFTVVEGVAWNSVFNVLEHLAMAASGVAFALACLTMRTKQPQREE